MVIAHVHELALYARNRVRVKGTNNHTICAVGVNVPMMPMMPEMTSPLQNASLFWGVMMGMRLINRLGSPWGCTGA